MMEYVSKFTRRGDWVRAVHTVKVGVTHEYIRTRHPWEGWMDGHPLLRDGDRVRGGMTTGMEIGMGSPGETPLLECGPHACRYLRVR